ncbi:polysaccharide pyruvyl transferase family protein [Rhodococcus sp. DMF-1]|uniref:polysaccharide pyruvyl transferase family protein n=1 Tax=Rhodococcus TaxID=1827 RepID=UPI00029A066A|nr:MULTISPECIES: polysaccharide pyruvyl transferase family protein [Rhodococcus]MDO2377540.1 polysaccharide pyruvyl transferase family protein [Rhodococcus ruber]UIR34947.1 polysaccharide pyruvyl transferase family protein [Rhodococcus sp. DMF-1]
MKRIGILTRHVYPNYGSLLQCRALEGALASLGAAPHVIDYFPHTDRPLRLAASRLRESRVRSSAAKSAVYLAVQTPNMATMSLRFRKFQRRYLTLTPTCEDETGVLSLSDDVDLVLTGSDQVWNSVHGQLDPVYFLDGQKPDKKHSYAASFGSNAPSWADAHRVASWLEDFTSVSVRERSAQAALEAMGIPSRVDVDPVLLHGREYWTEFSSSYPPVGSRYILVYQLHNTPGFKEKLAAIRRRHNLPVRRVTPDAKMLMENRASDYLVDPAKFVALFRDASYVVTDSFHGTAFSLAFGRPLYALLPQSNSTRNEDLLASVGLTRLASALDDVPVEDPHYDADDIAAQLLTHSGDSWSHLRELVRTGGRP